MSFGTVFWSSEPEKIWMVIETLIDLKMPFVCYVLHSDLQI